MADYLHVVIVWESLIPQLQSSSWSLRLPEPNRQNMTFDKMSCMIVILEIALKVIVEVARLLVPLAGTSSRKTIVRTFYSIWSFLFAKQTIEEPFMLLPMLGKTGYPQTSSNALCLSRVMSLKIWYWNRPWPKALVPALFSPSCCRIPNGEFFFSF